MLPSSSSQVPDQRKGHLKLGIVSISFPAGDSSTSQTGQDSKAGQPRTGDTRSRRTSSSVSSTSSTPSAQEQPSIGLTERLFNLAKQKHDKSSSSTDMRISNEGYQKAKNHATQQQQPSTQQRTTSESIYECWDDFLKAYSQGHFPDDAQIRPKHLGPDLPPFPPYACALMQSQPPPFLAAPLPPNEEQRLRALYSFQILDTGTDLNFDRIAQLVGTVLRVSGCMICLVDQDNVAIKASYRAANMECRREVSLSAHAILRAPDDPLVILDATKDWRFNGLPAVKGVPLVRFYAGAALATSDGNNIGSLCVIDPEPRATFTEKERLLLVDFAAVVMREMTLWNDQVNLCIRTRMMRDITCWVRACLDMTEGVSIPTPTLSPEPKYVRGISFDISQPRLTPSPDGVRTPRSTSTIAGPPGRRVQIPTPRGSPMFPSKELRANGRATQLQGINGSVQENSSTGDQLRDKAFPSACNMIQATLGADAVYLVQAGSNKSFLPQAGSGVSWNLWSSKTPTKGAVSIVSGAEYFMDPGLTLECLASSLRQHIDEPVCNARRQGTSWVCAEVGCRPHRIRDFQQEMAEPVWERDLPIISEAMCYVRQLKSAPERQPGQCPLYICCPGSEENNWFESTRASSRSPARADDPLRPDLLCHTFQGTLPEFEAGSSSPYRSCVIMPIRCASSADYTQIRDEEPWAYFVVLTSSPTKQFLLHERIYLKNFGSCLVTEVMKRRIVAADKTKGIFIKNISHELRTPLHIILGILELLQANTEETLSEQQLTMLRSAEASGDSLIDTINNIIDLTDLDPNNLTDVEIIRKQLSDLVESVSEIDIRELCEEVAGSMAKRCVDKDLVINPSWSPAPHASLFSSIISMPSLHSAAASISGSGAGSTARAFSNLTLPRAYLAPVGDSVADPSTTDSRAGVAGCNIWSDDHTSSLELLVAMDEPEETPEEDTHWKFMLNLPIVTRILTQLLENAIKFTTTGFVEISAMSPPLDMFPLRPPRPDARPVLFTVRDTGSGISPEYVQGHLFERFSQEDPIHAGTGLGLALVKLLVESLGGWLEVWSEGVEGKGCVIRVLIWATPSEKNKGVQSLKDEVGPWRGKAVRFFVGDSAVGSDRLWKIVGERMMGEDLGMAVERGHDQDVGAEEMLKGLKDGSPCDLLVVNDDLGRLEAYLTHWGDQHQRESGVQDGQEAALIPMATPLLMLTTAHKEKKARAMVDTYLRTWMESTTPLDKPVRVVIMSKPAGPLKLMHSLHDCFSDSILRIKGGCSTTSNKSGLDHGLQAHAGTTTLCEKNCANTGPYRLIRSITSRHTTTLSTMGGGIGSNGPEFCSAESVIKSSFKFPPAVETPGPTVGGHFGVGIGYFDMAYSPGGLVVPHSKEEDNRDEGEVEEEEEKDVFAATTKPDAQKQELELGSSLVDYRPPLPLPTMLAKRSSGHIGGDLLDESLQTPPQPTPPQPHPDQQVQQQAHGHGHGHGQGQEQPAVKQKARSSIRNFMGSGHLNRSSRKIGAGASPATSTESPFLSSPTAAMSGHQAHVRDSSTAFGALANNPSSSTYNNDSSFPWSDLRVLIVEDNVTNRMILRTFFKKNGVITVVEAENGQVGVDRFEEALERQGPEGRPAFDFVLMDLQMPVMDGNMATKRIREAEGRVIKTSEGKYCPSMIFALTGLAGEEDKRLAFECGVDGYMTKPVSLKGLANLLTTCRPPPPPPPSPSCSS
ncbi:His Kinase A domain containing protein [Linnemannia hyalina]|uniref:histidine kinase n=1 Tax=Linnemannia hyalina TaxID=64524 RepID=A0A9P8BY13_9FUNG|nr:His Kinase A domain containing protein [Linnemannia hyalina]